MNATALSWLAAEYHLPATYSCRLLFSSSNSALVSPAPWPVALWLALIRTGLEIFGRDVVRDSLFPWIRAASVFIRPPEGCAECWRGPSQRQRWPASSLPPSLRATWIAQALSAFAAGASTPRKDRPESLVQVSMYTSTLKIAYQDTELALYTTGWAEDNKHITEVKNPRLIETGYQSSQFCAVDSRS